MMHEAVDIPITVDSLVAETSDYLSIFFERPIGFTFEAGDWMDINFTVDQPSGGTTYSFASSPDEDKLRITFRKGFSPFKRRLETLKPGDTMLMAEYGNDYGFRLKQNQASTLIAGGVGITPFRSMLKQLMDNRSQSSVQLIYLHSNGVFLFQDELDVWQQVQQGLTVQYIVTKDLNRKDREKLLRSCMTDTDRQFYISGPSGMIRSTLQLLEDSGVNRKSVKVDDFGM